jgi:predicted transcriptional regulator
MFPALVFGLTYVGRKRGVMAHIYGMATMTHRTTFALDGKTIGRLKHLAGAWHTSQAEVVRRAIALADEKATTDTDTTASLRAIHTSGKLLAREHAEAYLAEIKSNRNAWRGDE